MRRTYAGNMQDIKAADMRLEVFTFLTFLAMYSTVYIIRTEYIILLTAKAFSPHLQHADAANQSA